MSNNVNKVTVIGTGVIGAGWIIRCLAHNKNVVAYDKDLGLKKKLVNPNLLDTEGFEQHAEILCKVIKEGKFYVVPF